MVLDKPKGPAALSCKYPINRKGQQHCHVNIWMKLMVFFLPTKMNRQTEAYMVKI